MLHTLRFSLQNAIYRRTEPQPVLGHNYTLHKYMFRLPSSMSSSRWYKGLNCTFYTTRMTSL